MKILYVTTIGLTMGFFKDVIKELLDEGHTIDIACNEDDAKVPDCYREWGCKVHQISCSRSPFDIGNIKAIKELKQIVSNNCYDIVHCHTPIAGVCTRLACKKLRKDGLRVIYTAHGFHFYKGAPLKNWLVYYPIEKLCAHFTDVLITINHEDYELAKKKMKAKRIEYVPGVGIDVDKFKNTVVDKAAKRRELGIPEDAFLLLSVGELNKNKNHEVVIRAIAQIGDKNIHYMIAGKGPLKDYLLELASQLGVADQLHLLGYQNDIVGIYKSSDLYIHPSFREGLPASLMEAMASGLPCIVSFIRGNTDLINENGGRQFDPYDKKTLICELTNLFAANINEMGVQNCIRIQTFSLDTVKELLLKIYEGAS